MCIIYNKRDDYYKSYTFQRKFYRLFSLCKVYICGFITIIIFIISDEFNIVSALDSEENYSFINDSYENLTLFYQNISDFDNNSETTINNINNFDSATELESSVSVTEDSDSSFQSETNRKLFLFLTPDEDICNCDLSSNVCDINCCCDPNCSEEDMQIFSECSHQVLTPDENYCYQQDIILRNNTVYKMIKNPKNGMFCILHDNFKHHLRFKDMPILKSHRDLNTLLQYKYKSTYSWDTESENVYESTELKAGNPIYIEDKSKKKTMTTHWSLPSSCLSDICSCKENVRYLHDFQSSCSYVIDDLKTQCENNDILSGEKFINFCFSLLNAPSHNANSLADLIIHTKMVNVSSSEDDEYYTSQLKRICPSEKSKRLQIRKTADFCQNVVKRISFTVEQNGSNGITDIFFDFEYVNIDFKKQVITQDYSVSFVWSNASEVEKKSGNPGYQIGLPILAATNGSDADSDEMSRSFYKNGLSVLDKDIGSLCSKNRQSIKFGENLKTGCILKHNFTSCKDLRARVSDIFLGPSKRQIFVGVFGNANISDPEEWIEVFHGLNDPPDGNCFASLGLKIDIVYAAVGTVANPQYKIVGVSYHYNKPEFIDLTCVPLCRDITLRTSVSFFDVTLPAMEHYAKVPSIKANLPNDFFYPFLYGKSSNTVSNMYFIFLLHFLVYVF